MQHPCDCHSSPAPCLRNLRPNRLIARPGAGAVANGSRCGGVAADPARPGADPVEPWTEGGAGGAYGCGSRPEGGVGWCCGWGAGGRTAGWW